jgi:ATP-binding cassette subfamily F protein 3
VVTAYITGLVQDEDEEVDEIVEMVRGMLWDAKVTEEALESFISRLSTYLEASSSGRQKTRPTVHRLEKAIDMKTSGMSTTIALSGQVDLEHGGKSQVRLVITAVADDKLTVNLSYPWMCYRHPG